MPWFSVRLLLRCDVGAKRNPTLFEDRIVLVNAPGQKAAEAKAKRIAKRNGSSYKNVNGTEVRWTLERIVESVDLFDEKLKDGTEVYWRFFRSADPLKRLVREGTKIGFRK